MTMAASETREVLPSHLSRVLASGCLNVTTPARYCSRQAVSFRSSPFHFGTVCRQRPLLCPSDPALF
jgi:hypothetical protein